jgi:hypothetical protein
MLLNHALRHYVPIRVSRRANPSSQKVAEEEVDLRWGKPSSFQAGSIDASAQQGTQVKTEDHDPVSENRIIETSVQVNNQTSRWDQAIVNNQWENTPPGIGFTGGSPENRGPPWLINPTMSDSWRCDFTLIASMPSSLQMSFIQVLYPTAPQREAPIRHYEYNLTGAMNGRNDSRTDWWYTAWGDGGGHRGNIPP